MTIDAFLEQLTVTRGPWYVGAPFAVDCVGPIRRDVTGRLCCPITALGSTRWPAQYLAAAKDLGLTTKDADKIAIAADGRVSHHLFDGQLRNALLRATVFRNYRDDKDAETLPKRKRAA